MAAAKILVARETFACEVDGAEQIVYAGSRVAANDPRVKGREGLFEAKAVDLEPAVLASLTTTAALLLQLLKPHERWRLLRVKQGLLEAERFRYVHQLSPYDERDSDARLLQYVVAAATTTMDEWAGLQPESAGAAQLLQGARR
jgi:hypothetical protein